MRKSERGLLYQDLDRLFRRGTVSSGDGALLESFLTEGNEAAFEALVNRHGPMVRGVCRRLLPSPHDADDAFQATFLVLVRKGGRLRDPDRLGPWLHGVATRVAGKARARASRRKLEAIVDVPAREGGGAEWSDVMPIIDAELARLPSKHRDVLVACLLDGATAEEASRRLACPVGTVKSRLARAREALRARLTSRGVAPALAFAAIETTDVFAFASPVSSTLIRATLKTATTKAVAPGVVALTEGVASAMISKSTITLVAAAGVGLAGLGAAAWLRPTFAQVHLPGAENPARPEAPERTKEAFDTEKNLKAVLLAVHNYHSTNDRFPPAAFTDGGIKPTLSWRVALLPYLGQNDLYLQFHLDEPWDGPHNLKLLERMPDVFETPNVPAPAGFTRIRGFSGRGTIFDPEPPPTAGASGGMMGMMGSATKATIQAEQRKAARGRSSAPSQPPAEPPGVSMMDVTDGTSNTIFAVVARDATPWTKPGELPFVMNQEMPALDDSDPRGVILAMCDGSVHTLPRNHRNTLPFLITRNGGEVVSQATFPPVDRPQETANGPTNPTPSVDGTAAGSPLPTTPAAAPVAIAPSAGSAPAPASSVEQRLQRLEEKFDRLLEKLDAR